MLIYAGIDEAGYGPMFGPFIIGRTVFSLPHLDDPTHPPNLWKQLSIAVCEKANDKKKRIAVGDSKKLYTKSAGVKHLERATLSFAALTGKTPDSLDQWLQMIAADGDSSVPDQLWYTHDWAIDETTPPTCSTADEIKIAAGLLRRASQACGVKCEDMANAIIYESRYNEMVAKLRSKARLAWMHITRHLDHVWKNSGTHPVIAVVDRQGGRTKYLQPLRTSFPNADIRILEENTVMGRYELTRGRARMVVSFEIQADANHLPTALASMSAKYTREMLMKQFNAYFLRYAPELKPTAGYVQDGRRFLKDITPLLEQLGLDPKMLIREK